MNKLGNMTGKEQSCQDTQVKTHSSVDVLVIFTEFINRT